MKQASENDLTRLRHMLDAAREVRQFMEGKTRQSLDEDLLLLRGVCMSIGIIGEAASRITSEFRDEHPQIAWQPIIGMRNFIVHAYFQIDKDILWNTITQHIQPLINEIEAIFEADKDNES